MICKILHKIRENMSEECDQEETDNKSEDSLQYMENRDENKPYVNYRTHNGVLPQDFTQTNSTIASGQLIFYKYRFVIPSIIIIFSKII